MAGDTADPVLKLVRPAYGIELDLLPLQGTWTEEQYLVLSNQTNHLVEFTDGRIELVPLPTSRHQVILAVLFDLFRAVVGRNGGEVLFAALRLRLRAGKFRTPDILMLLDAADPR